MTKKDFRCQQCNRKLAEAIFTWISIKCPRCGHLNTEKAQEPR
ncbi:Com family DNA-binding transcriptional regulator [Alcanivorax jadensis]